MRVAPRLAAPTGIKRHNGGMGAVTAAGDLPGGSNAFGALGTGAQTPARQAWQFEAWGYFDAMPELHYGAQFVGSCMSRIKLRLAWLTDNNDVAPVFNDDGNIDEECPVDPQTIANAVVILAAFRDPLGGPGALLEALGKNLTVTGESHLLARDLHDENGTVVSRRWEVLSTDEIRRRGSVKRDAEGKLMEPEFERVWGAGRPNEPIDPKTSFVLRVYRRHPRWGHISDSATRPLLDIMEIIVLLARQLRATVLSRLAGAGVLWIPSEMDLPDDETAPEGSEEDDPFARKLFKNMTTPISDRGSASSVVPLVIRADADLIPAVHHLTFETKDDEIALHKMEALLERFAQGMDLPVEVIRGHMSTTFCADPETEILTEDGWRRHEELLVGDSVMTLDHQSGVAEWQPVEFIHRFDVVDEPMLRISGKAHDSLTTASHRWPVIDLNTTEMSRDRLRPSRDKRNWQTSDTLRGSHRIVTAAPQRALPSAPKYDDDFVELVAWHWTEGHVHRGTTPPGVTTITQSNEVNSQYCDRIRAMLTRLFGAPQSDLRGYRGRGDTWTERRDRDRDMRRFVLSRSITATLEGIAPYKVVGPDFIRALTLAQLNLFIDVSLIADGTRTNMGSRVITQSKPERLDGIELACILSGRTPCRWHSNSQGWDCFHLAISEKTTAAIPQRTAGERRASRSWIDFTGTVWCPTTRNGTWLARRNGNIYFTGNSNAVQIDESTFKAHLEPMIELICGFLTAGYLWGSLGVKRPVDAPYDEPTLIALPGQDIARLCITYDASALVTHENREKNAIEAGIKAEPPIISPSSTRRALGFSDADALTDEERDEWIRVRQLIGVKESIRAEEQGLGGISLADPDVQNALDPGTELPEANDETLGP